MPLLSLNERKVCIVVCGTDGEKDIPFWEYMVFIIDLKWESDDVSCDELVTSMTPTVRLSMGDFHEAAFCVLGSTLYLFDGYSESFNPGGGKSMYTYQLSDGISNLKLDKHMFSEGPAMHEIKVDPRAMVTPNGKILVFSQTIYYPTTYECDFELYDPVEREWLKLPSLRPSMPLVADTSYMMFNYFYVESCTFMEGNVLFVKTEMGAFTLDITARKKVWKINGFHRAGALPSHAGNTCVVINKEICIVPYTAYDITKYDENEDVFSGPFYQLPNLREFNCREYYGTCSGAVLLENRLKASKEFNVCFFQCGTNEESNDSELLLQVYSCNLKECREGLRNYRRKKIEERKNGTNLTTLIDIFEFPGAKKVKSLRIVVKIDREPFYSFNFSSFASIPPIEIDPISRKRTRSQVRLFGTNYVEAVSEDSLE